MHRHAMKWLIGIAALTSAGAAAVYLFDWNMLRAPLARRVEQATGRAFAINGNLDVKLSLKPRVIAQDLVLGNADWAREPNMAQVGRLEFTFDALALLRGRALFDEIALRDPRIFLERNAEGAVNWQFGGEKRAGEPPAIKALTIEGGRLSFFDPGTNSDMKLEISTVPEGQAEAGMLKLRGSGRFKGMAASLDGYTGSVLSLGVADSPYPIRVQAMLGTTRARVDGTLFDPLHLRGEDMNFLLEGADLAQLFPIAGVPLPPTPPYRLGGHLRHDGGLWTFRRFAGRVGRSDLSGDFSVDLARKPQYIKADLVSRHLDMSDLGGLIGADRGEAKSPVPPPPGRVLPHERFNLEKLRVANADVKFRGEHIVTQRLPLENIVATLKLREGVLALEPLAFGVAGGTLVSQVRMDARQSVIRTRADIAVKRLQLEKLFPGFKLSRANAGLITGRANLDTRGNSVATMLALGNGDTALVMEGGSVSELLVRLLNLDVANAIPVLLTGDRQLPVRCMVARLEGAEGDFRVRTLVLDTGKAVVTGSGGIDFSDESLDLELVSKSKGFSLAALRGPINVKGTFRNPRVRPDIPKVVGRGGIAAALAVATGGLGGFIPLLDFGGAQDSNCAELVQGAQK